MKRQETFDRPDSFLTTANTKYIVLYYVASAHGGIESVTAADGEL